MANKCNPFMSKRSLVEEKRWSKLQEPIITPNEEPKVNKYDSVSDRFKIDERINTFAAGEKQERTYSSFISFTEKPKKPDKIFDMETMTEGTLDDEFPSLC